MLTRDDVMKLLSDFRLQLTEAKSKVEETQKGWKKQRSQVENAIATIHHHLQIGK